MLSLPLLSIPSQSLFLLSALFLVKERKREREKERRREEERREGKDLIVRGRRNTNEETT